MGEARGKGASAVLLVPQVCSAGNAVGCIWFQHILASIQGHLAPPAPRLQQRLAKNCGGNTSNRDLNWSPRLGHKI